MESTSAPWQRKPLEDGDCERVVVHSFRTRSDRLLEFGVHVFRARLYLDLTSVQILPGGGRGQLRRMSFGGQHFADFFTGVLALEKELHRSGEL